jgi:lipopolysaccharide export system permease protein
MVSAAWRGHMTLWRGSARTYNPAMDCLTRYVLRQALIVALLVGVIFSAAVWLLQSLRLIDLIVNRGLSLGLFLYLALLVLPRFVDAVLPIAVFTAVLFVYVKLISESELVAMRASGVSQWSLAKPAFIVGLAGMVTLLAMSAYFLPTANRAFKDLQFEIRNKFASVLIQESVFNALSDTLMVYVKERAPNGDLVGLLIQNNSDPLKPVTVSAERGAMAETADGPRIVMENGVRQVYDRANGKLSTLDFKKYSLDLADLRNAPGIRARQPDELYFSEILRNLGNRALVVELNARLAGPLMALSMAAIPILCLLPGQFNRRGQTRRVLMAVTIAITMEIVDIACKDLATRSFAAIPFIYLNALGPFLAALWLLGRDGMRARTVPRLAAQRMR